MKAHEFRALRGRPSQSLGSRDMLRGAAPTQPTWVWGNHAIEEAAGELLKLPQPVLLAGEAKLLMPLRKRISQAWIEAGVELVSAEIPEGAECCESELEKLLEVVRAKRAGTLLGLGGGKCLDLVKWAGLKSGLPVATVPTSAATCACATAVVVVHDAQGAVLDVLDLPAPPKLCVADLEILNRAPERLLCAGVADTLAKWLEWSVTEACLDGSAPALEAFDLLQAGPGADREAILNACLRLSAEASNAGMAPAAVAHSFCAGISLLPESNVLLHGEWAGLGLLFQAWLLKRNTQQQEIFDPRPSLKAWDLPLSLPFKLSAQERGKVAERILDPQESIHAVNFSAPLSLELLEEGLDALQA